MRREWDVSESPFDAHQNFAKLVGGLVEERAELAYRAQGRQYGIEVSPHNPLSNMHSYPIKMGEHILNAPTEEKQMLPQDFRLLTRVDPDLAGTVVATLLNTETQRSWHQQRRRRQLIENTFGIKIRRGVVEQETMNPTRRRTFRIPSVGTAAPFIAAVFFLE